MEHACNSKAWALPLSLLLVWQAAWATPGAAAGAPGCAGRPPRFPVSGWDARPLHFEPFTDEFRVQYYLGAVREPLNITLNPSMVVRLYTDSTGFAWDCLVVPRVRKEGWQVAKYYEELKEYVNAYRQRFNESIGMLFLAGDVAHGFHLPVFTKTRPAAVGKSNRNVLLLLTKHRHLKPLYRVAKLDTTSHKEKKPTLLWRGATTGVCTKEHGRCHLALRWCNANVSGIDVGFSELNRRLGTYGWKTQEVYEHCVRGDVSLDKLVQYKYQISAEGNDVASNLKWMLYSNSTVFMPQARITSWFMEDQLVPWVHYVPLEADFCDLQEKYEWCIQHPQRCEDIAIQGRAYIKQFLDEERELRVVVSVMREYGRLVNMRFDGSMGAAERLGCNLQQHLKQNPLLNVHGAR